MASLSLPPLLAHHLPRLGTLLILYSLLSTVGAVSAACIPLSLAQLSSSDRLTRAVAPSGLPTVYLHAGAITGVLTAEVAHTPQQNARGLGFRTGLNRNSAMLFAYPRPQRVVYSMKNTHIPLSCAFIDATGTILEIHDMQPNNPTPVASRSDHVQFVLEVNQGWFKDNAVTVGTGIHIVEQTPHAAE